MAVNDKGYIDASPKPRAEGHKFTHQATQAGTGGGTDVFMLDPGLRLQKPPPPSPFDEWDTLDGLLATPREVWEYLVNARLLPHIPSELELRQTWNRGLEQGAPLLRALAKNEPIDFERLKTNRRTAITPPFDTRQWFSPDFLTALSIPWLRRTVKVNGSGIGTGYLVGPRHILTCSHVFPWPTGFAFNGPYAPSNYWPGPDGDGGGMDWTNYPWPPFSEALGEGWIDLSKMEMNWPFGAFNLSVSLFSGILAGNGLTLPIEYIYVPYKPFPRSAAEFNQHALADVAVLVLPEKFAGFGELLGWSGVLDYGWLAGNNMAGPDVFGYLSTGYGASDFPQFNTATLEIVPPPGSAGFTTPRYQLGCTFAEANYYPASEDNKNAGIMLGSTNSDATGGDSGSSVLTVPGWGPVPGMYVVAIELGATPTTAYNYKQWQIGGMATFDPDKPPLVNWSAAGEAIQKPVIAARQAFPA